MVPALEKILVDRDADKEYASLKNEDIQREYQQAFELYPINISRLLRYAGRKGEKEETLKRVNQINQERVNIIKRIQDFFLNEPVKKAWMFGSFSRMEDRPDSDIDILVDLDRTVPIGLLKYARMAGELENILGRKVDLVAEGSIKPFAQDSIDHDKVLIYERA
ncbi:MAG: nucleotidyltransferase family protein [Bacteroidales bacterium]|nr:nucleotidyltransferase family protein [Bacteroidales bacterium]